MLTILVHKNFIEEEYLKLDKAIKQIGDSMKEKYHLSNTAFVNIIAKLDSLSPLKTLARGYSIIQKDGKIIVSTQELQQGDKVDIRLTDGTAKARIE